MSNLRPSESKFVKPETTLPASLSKVESTLTVRPVRIQRTRAKGWRMPDGAVYVGRGSVWGNPFKIGDDSGVFPPHMGMHGKAEILSPKMTREQVIEFYQDLVRGFLSPEMYPQGHAWQDRMHKRYGAHPSTAVRLFLRGKPLVCWCSLDQPCHADVLLEIANS